MAGEDEVGQEFQSLSLDLSPENWDDTALLRAYNGAKRQASRRAKGERVTSTPEAVPSRGDEGEASEDAQGTGERGRDQAEAGADVNIGVVDGEEDGEKRYLDPEWANYYYGYYGNGTPVSSDPAPTAQGVGHSQGDVWSKARDLALLSMNKTQISQGLADLMASWYCAGYQAGLSQGLSSQANPP